MGTQPGGLLHTGSRAHGRSDISCSYTPWCAQSLTCASKVNHLVERHRHAGAEKVIMTKRMCRALRKAAQVVISVDGWNDGFGALCTEVNCMQEAFIAAETSWSLVDPSQTISVRQRL